MEKNPPPTISLDFSEKGLEALVSSIESRIINTIKENPSMFFPSSNAPKEIKFYTTDEVAEKLRVTPTTVRNLCHNGKIKYARPGGRNIMVTEDDYNEYLQTLLNNRNE